MQFALDNFDKWGFHQRAQRGFIWPGPEQRAACSAARRSAAAPRGDHSEIIIEIQFGFVTGDRALLLWDSWACLMWSSAPGLSVVSLSLRLLSPTAPDRGPSHSSLKGQTFFPPFLPVSCQGRNSRHSVPGPTLWRLPPLPGAAARWTQSGLNKQQLLSQLLELSGLWDRRCKHTIETSVQSAGIHAEMCRKSRFTIYKILSHWFCGFAGFYL